MRLVQAVLALAALAALGRPATAAPSGHELRQHSQLTHHRRSLADQTEPPANCQLAQQIECESSVGPAICCSRNNHRCDTNSSGHARCAACPQMCLMACLPGYTCTRDHAGCHTCLRPCTDDGQCSSQQKCGPAHPSAAGSYCRTSPCAAGLDPCAGNGTRCAVTAAYQALCSATPACNDASNPCTGGQVCVAGACRDNPCATAACPIGQRCVVSSSSTAQCVPVAAVKSSCSPACRPGYQCRQAGSTWQCVRVRTRRPARPR